MSSILQTFEFLMSHPLTRRGRLRAIDRFIRWQFASRLHDEIIFQWLEGAVLAVKNGMAGATGNIYCGLHEFTEMAFLLHLLRPSDLFLDIGANIGSYTVLASKVCGARSVAFEPDPATANTLRRNLRLNSIEGLARVEELALGETTGDIAFTVGLDSVNRVAGAGDRDVRMVSIKALDEVPDLDGPVLAKLDVEGFEEFVLLGALRVLATPSLIAIQSESNDPKVISILDSLGFRRFFYEPFSRQLSTVRFGYRESNALFIRDISKVSGRVGAAPHRSVLGQMI